MLYEKLQLIGLSERESRVYIELLGLGSTTTSRLIRKTGIASSKIYDVLEKLIQKGLVTFIIKNNKRNFQATNPEKLINLIKEKEEIIAEILPSLKEKFVKTKEEVRAEIYKGKEGWKSIFEDILREKNDVLFIGFGFKARESLPYYMNHFYEKLQNNNQKLKILLVYNNETIKLKKVFGIHKNIKVRFLPEKITNLMSIYVYSDKVVIIPITSSIETSPELVLIRSKESADSYRQYFEWLWDLAR
mgnify:CR=1 FL=1